MRDRILAALLTLAVFATRLLGGQVAEHHRPFPGPPGASWANLAHRQGEARQRSVPPVNRAQLADQIEKLRPQMDAFRDRVTEIYTNLTGTWSPS